MMRAAIVALSLIALAGSSASAQKQGKRRKSLQEKLGIEASEKDKTDAEPESTESSPAQAPDSAPGDGKADRPGDKASGASPKAPSVFFEPKIRAALVASCRSCHGPKGMAKSTAFVLGDDPQDDFDNVRKLVSPAAPSSSALLREARGEKHGGGAIWKADSAEYQLVIQWLSQGARFARKTAKETPASRPDATATAPEKTADEKRSVEARANVSAPDQQSAAEASSPQSGAQEEDVFSSKVYPILRENCAQCHGEGSFAAGSFTLASTAATARDTVIALGRDTGDGESRLLSLGDGRDHAGGAVWAQDSADRAAIAAWIGQLNGDSNTTNEGVDVDSVDVDKGVDEGRAAKPKARAESDGTLTGAYRKHGLRIPGGFRLNGFFDLSYERRSYRSNPFSAGADNRLQNYHAFLFVSRDDHDLPVGFSVEAINLTFWEAYSRFDIANTQFLIRIGKLLVPFGPSNSYHQSYGGLAGFDQRVLPAIWAREGIDLRIHRRLGSLTVSNNLYAVTGYELRGADRTLNLQADFAPNDDMRFGVGDRLAVSLGPLSAWYSAYLNPLGLGRKLFMQGLDLSLYRPTDLPILEFMSFGAGAIRADVSGGGPGLDYYHFASYFEVHVYPTAGLDLRYRQGLRTFGNRRGVIFDATRAGVEDASSHSLGASYRYRGLVFAAHHYWNLEKAGEIPDDFFRASLGVQF